MTGGVEVTEEARGSMSAVCPHVDDWNRGDDRRGGMSDDINDAKGRDPLSKLVVPPKSLSSDEKLPFMKSHIDWSVETSPRLTGEEPLHDVIDAGLYKARVAPRAVLNGLPPETGPESGSLAADSPCRRHH